MRMEMTKTKTKMMKKKIPSIHIQFRLQKHRRGRRGHKREKEEEIVKANIKWVLLLV